MVPIYITVFLFSLGAIVGLFSLRYVETTTGRTFAVPVRRVLDRQAHLLIRFGKYVVYVIEHIPSILLALLYYIVHLSAVGIALSARAAERWAHQLADSVSHKHNFERRQTRSLFLDEVRHHKETLVVPKEILKEK